MRSAGCFTHTRHAGVGVVVWLSRIKPGKVSETFVVAEVDLVERSHGPGFWIVRCSIFGSTWVLFQGAGRVLSAIVKLDGVFVGLL